MRSVSSVIDRMMASDLPEEQRRKLELMQAKLHEEILARRADIDAQRRGTASYAMTKDQYVGGGPNKLAILEKIQRNNAAGLAAFGEAKGQGNIKEQVVEINGQKYRMIGDDKQATEFREKMGNLAAYETVLESAEKSGEKRGVYDKMRDWGRATGAISTASAGTEMDAVNLAQAGSRAFGQAASENETKIVTRGLADDRKATIEKKRAEKDKFQDNVLKTYGAVPVKKLNNGERTGTISHDVLRAG